MAVTLDNGKYVEKGEEMDEQIKPNKINIKQAISIQFAETYHFAMVPVGYLTVKNG